MRLRGQYVASEAGGADADSSREKYRPQQQPHASFVLAPYREAGGVIVHERIEVCLKDGVDILAVAREEVLEVLRQLRRCDDASDEQDIVARP